MNIDQILADVLKHSKKNGTLSAKNKLQNDLDNVQLSEALLNNLGLYFYKNVEYELARHTFLFALNKYSNSYSIHNNLGLTLNRLGLGSDAASHYKKALNIKPDYHQARSNLAYVMLYFGNTDRTEILEAHKNIAKYALPKPVNYIKPGNIKSNSNRKIRVGYISSDLRNHAVGRFMCGILEEHNRNRFDIHIFDNRKNNVDETALKLKKLDLTWHNISSLSTEDSIKLITKHNIDILIDLSGHTNGGRPDIFSHRVCPIQVTYLGYPCTSGIPNMDFRIGDEFADLSKFEQQNTEEMLKLPVAMWSYKSWSDMPSNITNTPFQKNAYITFGSANNHAEGVSRDRVKLIHYSPTKLEHWNTLNDIDIALDTFPYNGTTTSCDLLSLGVPIVTLSGQSHVSRTTGSILHTLGLDSWIANSEADFIKVCQEKARAVKELSNLKKSIPTTFKNSSLGNPKIFITHYETLLENALKKITS